MSKVVIDRAFIEPTGEIAKKMERMRSLFRLLIDLMVDNVYPGQPIPVRWAFNMGMTLGVDAVNVRFRIDGISVHEDSGIATGPDGTGERKMSLTIADADAAKKVYRIGLRRLDIEIDVGQRALYRGHRPFHVMREPMDASWWQWRDARFAEYKWKEPYQLAGRFLNKGHSTLATVWFGLTEVRRDDDPTVAPCDYYPEEPDTRLQSNLTPDSTTPVTFPRTHDWKWLTSGSWTPTSGPTTKLFAYSVAFYAVDEFGNQYATAEDAYCSDAIERRVTVSDSKLGAAGSAAYFAAGALSLMIAAGLMAAGLVTAWLAAGLVATAAGLYATASSFAYLANDPPEPDPSYREPVAVADIPRFNWEAANGAMGLQALRRFMEAAARIIALENARTLTRARMISARIFREPQFIELHQRGYLRIEQEMEERASEMHQLLPEVRAEISHIDGLDADAFVAMLDRMSATGLSTDLYNQLAKAQVSSDVARDLAALLRDPDLAEFARENGITLAPLAAGVSRFVRAVRAEREAILAGEDACSPPGETRFGSDDETERSDRPRKRRCCC